jgi:hypothetical protein
MISTIYIGTMEEVTNKSGERIEQINLFISVQQILEGCQQSRPVFIILYHPKIT